MASSYNISAYQGDLIQLNLAVKDANSIPISLTGYDVRGSLKTSYGSSNIILDLKPQIINPISGLINITIPSLVTETLPVNIYFYDIERYPSGISTGNSSKLLRGKFNILPETTT